MGIRNFLLAVAAVAISATAASGATILYDFDEDLGDAAGVVTYTVDGVELTVSAGPGGVNRSTDGLGVTGGAGGDSLGSGESLSFAFDAVIKRVKATYYEADGQAHSFLMFGNGQK